MSRTALCSTSVVMMCLPFAPCISTAPLMARLMPSVEPDVKMISFGEAPIREAICLRELSTAPSASQPKECERLAALPKEFVK